jgi:predicted amidohydrolase
VRPLSIAALQTAPVAGDPESTLAAFAARLPAVKAAVPHVRVVMLPELHLAALPGPLDEHSGYAEHAAIEVPGDLTAKLGELARAHGFWLVPGSVYERAGDGHIHNTVLVVSPAGELVTTYRKVFPWQPHESCTPGDRFVTFDIPDVGRVGLAVCYDGNFPETCRQLAWMGAEVVLQPTLTTTSDRAAELVMARANAIFNQLYVVSVNACDPAGLGRSLIADPEGLVRFEAGSGEELITDVLDLDAVTRVREYGTAGVSRVWDQLDRTGAQITLPMYEGGTIRARPSG